MDASDRLGKPHRGRPRGGAGNGVNAALREGGRLLSASFLTLTFRTDPTPASCANPHTGSGAKKTDPSPAPSPITTPHKFFLAPPLTLTADSAPVLPMFPASSAMIMATGVDRPSLFEIGFDLQKTCFRMKPRLLKKARDHPADARFSYFFCRTNSLTGAGAARRGATQVRLTSAARHCRMLLSFSNSVTQNRGTGIRACVPMYAKSTQARMPVPPGLYASEAITARLREN